jgi:hypothetical protein
MSYTEAHIQWTLITLITLMSRRLARRQHRSVDGPGHLSTVA